MTRLPDALTLWPAPPQREGPPPYRRDLRRPRGPTFRDGPRGVFRAHYLRCGLCQRWVTYAGADLSGWSWHPEAGTVHRRCLNAAVSRGTFDPPGTQLERPNVTQSVSGLEGTPLEQQPTRERRRRRGRARGGLELAPWDGPERLETAPGWVVVVVGASRAGSAVLAAPVAQLERTTIRVRAPRSRKVVELQTWELRESLPSWYQLRRLRPVT